MPQKVRQSNDQQTTNCNINPLKPNSHMDPQQVPNNYGNQSTPQKSINNTNNNHVLSENKSNRPAIDVPSSSENKSSLSDKPTTGDSVLVQDIPKSLNTSSQTVGVKSGHRPDLRSEKDGYERRIGRGTSWRRDHHDLMEQTYPMRGRGRGSPPTRGRGRDFHRDYDTRDYPYRREFDRRPPPPDAIAPTHHALDSRGPPAYPLPDPFYEPRGGYPLSPQRFYDTRRDFPPEHSRYYDDYRRGDDLRDLPPRPPADPGRPYDRGLTERGDPSDYGRPYPRPRDLRDDYPRITRDRLPPDPRGPPRDPHPDPRYIDEGRRYFEIRI